MTSDHAEAPVTTASPEIRLLIGGELIQAAETQPVLEPSSERSAAVLGERAASPWSIAVAVGARSDEFASRITRPSASRGSMLVRLAESQHVEVPRA